MPLASTGERLIYKDLVDALRWRIEEDDLYRAGMDHYQLDSSRFERAARVLAPLDKSTVYDFGSFPGYGLWAFRECKRYVGVGKCPDWYREALLEKFKVGWLECDFESENGFPPPVQDADIIVLQEVLEHIRRPKLFLTALHSWAPRGAKLYLTTNNIHYLGYILKLAAGKEIFHPATTEDTVYPGHCTYYSLNGLSQFLEEIGFKVLSSTRFNFLPASRFYQHRAIAAIKYGLTRSVPMKYATHLEVLCEKP
jgi:hypothetical protein